VWRQEFRLDMPVNSLDNYGRTLAYVYVDDVFVNGELVAEGYAYAQSFGDSGHLYQTLLRLEKSAKENRQDLWGMCEP
jgi:micrococcal nuclease